MSDNYETALDAVLAALIANIKSTETFTHHTYYDYRRAISDYPTCLVKLVRDRPEAIGPSQTRHLTTFELRVRYRGRGTSANLDEMIGYVGEIIDAIEADRGLSTEYVETAEWTNVEYSSQARDRDTIFYHAYITVVVEHIRYV